MNVARGILIFGQKLGIFKFFIKETPQKIGAGEFFIQLLDLPHPGPGG